MSAARASWQLSGRTRTRLLVCVAVLLVALAGLLYHPPYVILRAGPAIDTLGQTDGHDLVRISGLGSRISFGLGHCHGDDDTGDLADVGLLAQLTAGTEVAFAPRRSPRSTLIGFAHLMGAVGSIGSGHSK